MSDAEHRIAVGSREDLAYVLSEASTLEHMIMCEYLFAAFSMKRSTSEGISAEELEAVKRWERVVTGVAIQEMGHLALVNNMLVSIGVAPFFQHPNFPQPSKYFSPNVRLALVPFGERALRHFLYLERPEGMSIEGVPGFEVLGDLNPAELRGGVVPKQEYFSTVGNLYRGLERGLEDLVARIGEDGVFIGAGAPQASEDSFGLEGVTEVTDLASAKRAVEGIVEMGEGARGDWSESHFGRFLGIFKEFKEVGGRNPKFTASRPVVAAYSRQPLATEEVPIITDPFTARVSDLFNAGYALAIGTLGRYYIHEKRSEAELASLADAAVGLMSRVVKTLGVALTSLPVGTKLPGVNAAPTFELQSREYLLPRREQAFMVMQERMQELAGHAEALSAAAPTPQSSGLLRSVSKSFQDLAAGLALT